MFRLVDPVFSLLVLLTFLGLINAGVCFGIAVKARSIEEKNAWQLLRKQLKIVTLLNIVLCVFFSITFVSFLQNISESTRFFIGGAVLLICVMFSQMMNSRMLLNTINHVSKEKWEFEFVFRKMLSLSWMFSLPIATTAMLMGGLLWMMNPSISSQELVYRFFVFIALVLFFVWHWELFQEFSLPGRLGDFPKNDWKLEAFALAKKMGAPLKELLMIRTGSITAAGAFALSGSRVAITDDLVASLKEREFLAVLAHEFQHLKQKKKLIQSFLILMIPFLVLSVFIAYLWSINTLPSSVSIVFVIFLSLLLLKMMKKQKSINEDEADDAAIKSIDSLAYMRALAKIYAINGKLQDKQCSGIYRGLNQRLERIRQSSNLNENTIQVAISDAVMFDPRSLVIS
jgi:Zn-dependent protease with chaperone function